MVVEIFSYQFLTQLIERCKSTIVTESLSNDTCSGEYTFWKTMSTFMPHWTNIHNFAE